MKPPEYCRVHSEEFKLIETPDGVAEKITTVRSVDLPDFSWLVCYLNQLLNDLLTDLADARAENSDVSTGEYDEFDDYGGWSVLVENPFGATVELGMSRQHWLMIGRENCPFGFVTFNEYVGGNHGFNLFQSCFTDFSHEDLLSKSKCLELIETWLETGNIS